MILVSLVSLALFAAAAFVLLRRSSYVLYLETEGTKHFRTRSEAVQYMRAHGITSGLTYGGRSVDEVSL